MEKYITTHDLYQALYEQSLQNEKTFEQMRGDVAQIIEDEVKAEICAEFRKDAPGTKSRPKIVSTYGTAVSDAMSEVQKALAMVS